MILCKNCDGEINETRINLTIIFSSKLPSPDDNVFCSPACTMEWLEDIEDNP